MFEHHQEEMEKLMKENDEFLRIYNRHQELDRLVTDAEFGTVPMEDLALVKLKKLLAGEFFKGDVTFNGK